MFVGTYTTGKAKGIYVYKFNAATGNIDSVSMIEAENPSYLAVSKNGKYVYAVSETTKQKISKVSAYLFNAAEGKLSFINDKEVGGANPCYVSVDNENKWLFTANYTGGSLSVLSLQKDGSIGKLDSVYQHSGKSVNAKRQTSPHVHTAIFNANSKQLFTTDLGTDKINIYDFKSSNSTMPLSVSEQSELQSLPGNGPRHIAFNPKKKVFCVVNELAGTIDVFDHKKGSPFLVQTISTDTSNSLEKGSADIHFTNDGKFLYVTNRNNFNTIACFAFNAKHNQLSLVQVESTGGKIPRNFVIEDSDNYILVANQRTDNIVVFKRNTSSGKLTNTGISVQVGSPVCLKLLAIKN